MGPRRSRGADDLDAAGSLAAPQHVSPAKELLYDHLRQLAVLGQDVEKPLARDLVQDPRRRSADREKRRLSRDETPLPGKLVRTPAAEYHLRAVGSCRANDLSTTRGQQHERVIAVTGPDEHIPRRESPRLADRAEAGALVIV